MQWTVENATERPHKLRNEEFTRVLKNEVLLILKKQQGFLEALPFFPEIKNEKALTVMLWAEKKDIERYEEGGFPKVEETIKPYLTTPIVAHNLYRVETTLCEHFEKTLAA